MLLRRLTLTDGVAGYRLTELRTASEGGTGDGRGRSGKGTEVAEDFWFFLFSSPTRSSRFLSTKGETDTLNQLDLFRPAVRSVRRNTRERLSSDAWVPGKISAFSF